MQDFCESDTYLYILFKFTAFGFIVYIKEAPDCFYRIEFSSQLASLGGGTTTQAAIRVHSNWLEVQAGKKKNNKQIPSLNFFYTWLTSC